MFITNFKGPYKHFVIKIVRGIVITNYLVIYLNNRYTAVQQIISMCSYYGRIYTVISLRSYLGA